MGSAQTHNLGWAPSQNLLTNSQASKKQGTLTLGIAQSSTDLRGKSHLCSTAVLCLRCFCAVLQEVLHKLRPWGRKTVALRPEGKTSLALHEQSKRWQGKTCSQFLAADCSQEAWGTLLTFCFCKAYYSGFYLTLHHTTEKTSGRSYIVMLCLIILWGKRKVKMVWSVHLTNTLILHQFGISLIQVPYPCSSSLILPFPKKS